MGAIVTFFADRFPDLLDINLTAAIVIVFVLCVRQFLKGATKIFSYALWGIVLLRLLVPVSVESPVSFVPERTAISNSVEINEVLPELQFETPQDRADNERRVENTPQGEPYVQVQRSMDAQTYLTVGWLLGVCGMVLWGTGSVWKLKRKLKVVIPFRKGIYIADDIDSPFVMGLFRPRIYLPGAMDPSDFKYVIAHERHHIRRGDPVIKALAFLALCIHWFNPFVWAAFIISSRDMEMSCDEAVIRRLGEQIRAEYSASLLNLTTGQRIFSGMPLAFGEGDTTGRVRNLARWKRPAVWVVLICVVLCIILAVCLLTDPEMSFPGEFEQYFVLQEKAELLSGSSQEDYADSQLSIGFESTSGPVRMVLELWYRETEGTEWILGDTVPLSLQDTHTFRIPSGCSFAVGATAFDGQNGYARISVRRQNLQTLILDPFERDLLTRSDRKSGKEAASAWTVPIETATAMPGVPSESVETYDWGISLKPDRVSRTGATALFVYGGSIPGQEGAELTYGDFLSLDRLVDGTWVSVEELPGYEYYVGDSSYSVVDGSGMVHEWDRRFGELPDGTYRMGKLVKLTRPNGSWEERTVFGEFSIPASIRTGMIPLEELPELYSGEQAMLDGCLVSRDGEAVENTEAFKEFVSACSRGEAGTFRIVDWYYGENQHFIVRDLNYDGSAYTLTWLQDGKRQFAHFSYLLHFTGEKEQENAAYDAYEHYVLVNDLHVTWQDICEGMISSQKGAAIDHMRVYLDYIYYPDTVELPENLIRAELVFQDITAVTQTDADLLAQLRQLFVSAEVLGYEPKTHSIGVGLELVLTGEDGQLITVELDPDDDLCRIYGEYIHYGRPDEESYILKLWKCLGIGAWPAFLYESCENAYVPMT